MAASKKLSFGDQFPCLRQDKLALIAYVMKNPIQGRVVSVMDADEKRISAAIAFTAQKLFQG